MSAHSSNLTVIASRWRSMQERAEPVMKCCSTDRPLAPPPTPHLPEVALQKKVEERADRRDCRQTRDFLPAHGDRGLQDVGRQLEREARRNPSVPEPIRKVGKGSNEQVRSLLPQLSLGATYAFSQRPLSRASRPLTEPISKGSKGSI
jgi:hypothetical protein